MKLWGSHCRKARIGILGVCTFVAAHAQIPTELTAPKPSDAQVSSAPAQVEGDSNSTMFRFMNPGEYSFNPLKVKRDPFAPPEIQGKEGSRDEITLFDLAEIRLVGILTGGGSKSQAMLLLPNGSSRIVRVGDNIGRRNGKVSRITTDTVFVQETFTDFKGRKTAEVTQIVLAQ